MKNLYRNIFLVMVSACAGATVYGQSPAFELEVSDVTSRDAKLKVVPADTEQSYMWGVVSAEGAERGGGIENIYEYRDRAWWEYQASAYEGVDWKEFAKLEESHGPHEGYYTALSREKLKWDTDYILYAYTLDSEYAPSSEVYHVEFRTLAPAKSDITFEVELVELVADEHPNRKGFSKATLRVTPSNDDPYANHLHEAQYYDQYASDPDKSMAEYLETEVYPYIASTRSGVQDLTYIYVFPDKEYVFVSLGYDDAPTSDEVHFFRFSGDPSGVEMAEGEKSGVYGLAGRILVEGEYKAMSVYGADGGLRGCYRGEKSIRVPKGVYVVSLEKDSGERMVYKVMVR